MLHKLYLLMNTVIMIRPMTRQTKIATNEPAMIAIGLSVGY